MTKKIVDSVFGFLDMASLHYGSMKAQQFSQQMYGDCLDLGMESPIEQMFWIACNALCESVSETVNPEPYQNEDGEMLMGRGIFILPQHLVGNYRVDFLLSQNGIGPSEFLSPVLVELDGHDFHDKDKRQRSYEKARDRFLVKSGFRVLHFTGSDVFADPFKTAYEALDMIGIGLLGLDKYNPADPLGGGV